MLMFLFCNFSMNPFHYFPYSNIQNWASFSPLLLIWTDKNYHREALGKSFSWVPIRRTSLNSAKDLLNYLFFKISAPMLFCFICLHKVLSWCNFISCSYLFCFLQGKHNLFLSLLAKLTSRRNKNILGLLSRIFAEFSWLLGSIFPKRLFKASTFLSSSPSS